MVTEGQSEIRGVAPNLPVSLFLASQSKSCVELRAGWHIHQSSVSPVSFREPHGLTQTPAVNLVSVSLMKKW